MSSTVFDTLAYAKRLKSAGVPEAQAEAQAEALAEAIVGPITTKADLKETELKIEGRMFKIEERINLLQWMIGFNLALSVAVLLKLFIA